MSMSEHETYTALVNPTTNLWGAMLQVQGVATKVKRDSTNPHFRNRYATLEAVWDTLRKPLHDAGLVVVQKPSGYVDGVVEVVTVIAHAKSGETLTNAIAVPCPKADPQGVGSAVTYACRYSLMALFGLPPSDDDGEAARVDNVVEVPRKAPDGTEQPTFEQAATRHRASIVEIEKAFAEGDDGYAVQCWNEIPQADQMALWLAKTKGGLWTQQEKAILKQGNNSA